MQNEVLVGQGDSGLRSQRFGNLAVSDREGTDFPGFRIHGVDELENADDMVFMVLHRHGQEGTGAVSGALIETMRAREIELLSGIGIGIVNDHGDIV